MFRNRRASRKNALARPKLKHDCESAQREGRRGQEEEMPACQPTAERRSAQPPHAQSEVQPQQDAPLDRPGALTLAEFWARVDGRD